MSATLACDFDGTVVSCRERQLAALELAQAAWSVEPVDAEAFWARKRHGATTLAALTQAGLESTAAATVAARWVEIVEDDHLLVLDAVLDGVGAALRRLRDAEVAVAILTARHRAEAAADQAERLGITDWISEFHVVSPQDAVVQKASLLRELAAGGYVGDTELDAAAAKHAGVPFVPVGTGQRDPAWLAARLHVDVAADLGAAVAAIMGYLG